MVTIRKINDSQDELKSSLDELHFIMQYRPHESLQDLLKRPAQEPTQARTRERTRETTPEQTQEGTKQPSKQPAEEPVPQPVQELPHGQTQRGPKSLFEMADPPQSRSQDQDLTDVQEQLSNNKKQIITVIEELQHTLRGFLERDRIRPSPMPLVVAVLTFYVIDQLGSVPLKLWKIIDWLWLQILDLRPNSRRSVARDHEADHEAVEMRVA